MFENEVETTWQRGTTSESVFHAGRVGINTDRPDEALVVHGNVKITGHLMQPSDIRAKEGIEEVDTKEQLRNVQALRVVHYKYTGEFAETAGLSEDERSDTGVIAQEVEVIIPDAVRPAGNIVLPDGRQIENFLVVNKERIFMENIGAVKELCKVTDNLENRIDELERMNRKLAKLKRLDSIRSSASGSTGKPAATSLRQSLSLCHVGSVASSVVCRARRRNRCTNSGEKNICANRYVQATVAILVMIMAFCLIAMATLYILEWQKRNPDNFFSELTGLNDGNANRAALNSTQSAADDYGDRPGDGISAASGNRTSRPAILSTSMLTSNSTLVTVIHSPSVTSPGRQNGRLPVNGTSSAPPRSFTSLRSPPPSPVGKPEVCPVGTCQVYCCVANPTAHGLSTTSASPQTMSARRVGGDLIQRTTASPSVVGSPSPTPTTEIFSNNVDFSKGNKNRELRGPSAPIGPSYFLKPKDGKPLNRFARHLSSQYRELGRGGPIADDFLLSSTRTTSSLKSSSAQAAAWDGRVSYISLFGSNRFNVTLGSSYCMSDSDEYIRCLNGDAANYTYGIPLSKYMPEPYLTLRFHFPTVFSAPPDVCTSPVRDGVCPNGQTNATPNYVHGETRSDGPDSVFRTVHVNVGRSSIVAYRIRFPVVRGETNDLCEKPSSSLGDKFVEYNLVFYRVCDD